MLFHCNRSDLLISISRLRNKKIDCFDQEDEDEKIDLCSLNTNDIFRCYHRMEINVNINLIV